jgi:hypothetical protein
MPKKVPPSSLQAMLLMQSKVVTDRLDANKAGLLKGLLPATPDDAELVRRIFVHTLSRRPTAAETAVSLKALRPDRAKGAANLQWALLNSPEFLFNY